MTGGESRGSTGDPRYDPRYVNGPCEGAMLFHDWTWNGSRWECKRCEKLAHTRRFASIPCVACGKPIESVYETRFCGPCLDTTLGLDEDYVPFENEEVAE